MKSVTFLLPKGAEHPVGGLKVVFEYANRFAADGYIVHGLRSDYTLIIVP